MLRAIFAGLALTLGAAVCAPDVVSAMGRGPGSNARPVAGAPNSALAPKSPVLRDHGRWRRDAGHHRRGRIGHRFFGGPSLYGYDPGFQITTIFAGEIEAEPPRPVDPLAFANLPIRAGIPTPPTPEPTLYRIEGRRDRPATRIIRIGDAERAGARTRHRHTETGALLLTVPGR